MLHSVNGHLFLFLVTSLFILVKLYVYLDLFPNILSFSSYQQRNQTNNPTLREGEREKRTYKTKRQTKTACRFLLFYRCFPL